MHFLILHPEHMLKLCLTFNESQTSLLMLCLQKKSV